MRSKTTSVAVGVLLSGFTVYRAATQSFTHDESFAYFRFTSKPIYDVLTGPYDAANHVLFSIVSHAGVRLFGNSEIVLRLPAIVAGLVFYAALYLLMRQLSVSAWKAPLAIALIGSNPLILDHFAAARGYGCGLALWAWGLVFVLRGLGNPPPDRVKLSVAGVFFGLGIATNLMYLFPTVALMGAFLWVGLARRVTVARLLSLLCSPICSILVPTAAVALLLLTVPLSHSQPSDFYYGVESLTDSMESIVRFSVSVTSDPLAKMQATLMRWILGASLLFATVYPMIRCWKPSPSRDQHETCRQLVFLTNLAAFAAVIAAHALANVLLPYGRTALPFLFLVLLSAVALEPWPAKWMSRAWTAILGLLLLFHISAVRHDRFGEWPFDADTRRIVERVRDLPGNGETWKTCASWLLAPSLNYYLARLAPRARPVIRHEHGSQCDFVVLLPEDPHNATVLGQPIARFEISGAVLFSAAPGDVRAEEVADKGANGREDLPP